MPIISMFKLMSADLIENRNVLFIYADHRKQVGSPDVNDRFRHLANSLPIILKKHGGTDVGSFWKDSEMEIFKSEFTKSYDKVVRALNPTVVAVMCRESFDNDEFSVEKIRENSNKVSEFLNFTMLRFSARYSPTPLGLDR